MPEKIDWRDCPIGSEVKATLGAIQGDIGEIKDYFEKIDKKLEKQNNRVRKLEGWRTGMMAIIGFLLVVVPFLMRYVFK